MTRKEAGQIKARLTRSGWHITGELYDRDKDDREAVILAVSAAPEPFADEAERDFYSLEDAREANK